MPDTGSLVIMEHAEPPVAATARTIVVNGHRCLVPSGAVDFREVVELAFPGMPVDQGRFATVVYRAGPAEAPQGVMRPDFRIDVADEEQFVVAVADRS